MLMPTDRQDGVREATDLLSVGTFLITSHFEGRRAGVRARAVMVAANEPLLIGVTVRCGHWIEPLIRDSRRFGVCRIDDPCSPTMTLLLRRCAEPARPRDGDIFDTVPTITAVGGAPLLARSSLAFDCEVVRHLDLEADHELYVGRVIASRSAGARIMVEPKPELREVPVGPHQAKGNQ